MKVNNATFKATARIASGEERTLIWNQMVAMYAPFADYEVTAAPREIAVIVLVHQ